MKYWVPIVLEVVSDDVSEVQIQVEADSVDAAREKAQRFVRKNIPAIELRS